MGQQTTTEKIEKYGLPIKKDNNKSEIKHNYHRCVLLRLHSHRQVNTFELCLIGSRFFQPRLTNLNKFRFLISLQTPF